MKIAFYSALPPGGALRTVYEQIKGLSKKKHDIDLYTIPITNEKFLDFKYITKNIFTFSFNRNSNLPIYFKRLHSDLKNFIGLYFLHRKIANKINSGGYNIAIVHSDLLTQSPYLLRFLKIPNIYHCHEPLRIVYEKDLEFKEDVLFLKKWYEIITRFVRKRIDCTNACAAQTIITSSDFIRKQVKKYYNRTAITCHSGVDINKFKPSKSLKKNQIFFGGGKTKIKGYDLALDIIDNLQVKPVIKLATAGHFGEGKIFSESKMIKLYQESLLTLCLAKNEPFGLSSLESMSCGTPVIAINEGGYKETIINGNGGFLFDRDSKLIAKGIIKILNNENRYKKLCSDARKYIEDNWKWDNQVNQIEYIMNKVCQK